MCIANMYKLYKIHTMIDFFYFVLILLRGFIVTVFVRFNSFCK